MRGKIALYFVLILLFACLLCGCTNTQNSQTNPTVKPTTVSTTTVTTTNIPETTIENTKITTLPTTEVQTDDLAFLELQKQSQADLTTILRNLESAIGYHAYLTIRVEATSLKTISERYYDKFIKFDKFKDKNNELARNEYLKYLNVLSKYGQDMVLASEFHQNSQYTNAYNTAETAKKELDNIKTFPDIEHESIIETSKIYLDGYITYLKNWAQINGELRV